MGLKLDLSPLGWGRVVLGTLGGTLFCIALATYVDSFDFVHLDEAARTRALLEDVLVPTVLAAPLLCFLLIKLRQLAVSQHELAVSASTDPSTGLLNRQAFLAAVASHFATRRGAGARGHGALLVIDIDDLKHINDAVGEEAGEYAIAQIARALRASVRATDIVGRLNGDEFGILLTDTDRTQSQGVADRLCRAAAHHRFAAGPVTSPLTVSIGIGFFHDGATLPGLLDAADRALYAAKRNGGNRSAISPVDNQNMPLAA